MKSLKATFAVLLLLASTSAQAGSAAAAKAEKDLMKIDTCMDALFQEGKAKHGSNGFDLILFEADVKTDMFENEEHCLNEKIGEDLVCQAKVLKGALKVLIPDLGLESLRAEGRACEGF